MATENHQMTLTLLVTSDLHGQVLPIHDGRNQTSDIGFARISTQIRMQRKQSDHTLLIDNGDLLQGSPLTHFHAHYDRESIHPMILLFNDLGYDAGVIGNHEFNFGLDVLKKAVTDSDFPWLAANVLDERTKKPYFGTPYVIKRIGSDLRVGILGLTTHFIPQWEHPRHIAGIVFADAVSEAKKWVRYLREQKQVDVLVVSYHGGLERDWATGEATEPLTGENQGYQLCQEIEGIDVLLTGHQHRLIAGEKIYGTTILQPGHLGNALGKVTITLKKTDGKWTIVKKTSELLSMQGVSADPRVLQLIQPYDNRVQTWLDQPLGKIKGNMRIEDPLSVRLKDHAFIELINNVQKDAAKVDISCTSLFDNACPGLPPVVTMRDVMANYPYPNTLKVLRLTGRDIKAALEHTASYFSTYDGTEVTVHSRFMTPKPQHYHYDMWEGIDYVLNISRPVGERVVQLHYQGEPMDANREYDVVMNNYRASGGGHYDMFRGKPVIRDIRTAVPELIAAYIAKRGTVQATVNHNWKVVHD